MSDDGRLCPENIKDPPHPHKDVLHFFYALLAFWQISCKV